jgi:hypothetical protein
VMATSMSCHSVGSVEFGDTAWRFYVALSKIDIEGQSGPRRCPSWNRPSPTIYLQFFFNLGIKGIWCVDMKNIAVVVDLRRHLTSRHGFVSQSRTNYFVL